MFLDTYSHLKTQVSLFSKYIYQWGPPPWKFTDHSPGSETCWPVKGVEKFPWVQCLKDTGQDFQMQNGHLEKQKGLSDASEPKARLLCLLLFIFLTSAEFCWLGLAPYRRTVLYWWLKQYNLGTEKCFLSRSLASEQITNKPKQTWNILCWCLF